MSRYMCACGRSSSCLCELHPMTTPPTDQPAIERESIEDAMENDRCGVCGSVDHFREDCPASAVPDNAGLREALALVLRVHRLDTDRYTGDTMPCVCGQFDGGYLSRHQADALLAGPLAALLERDSRCTRGGSK